MGRPWALVWLAVGCVVLTAGAQASAATRPPSVAGGIYTDSIRESNVSLDVSTVTVANDPSGLVSFGVEFGSRAAGSRLRGNDLVVLGLDSDSDPTTAPARSVSTMRSTSTVTISRSCAGTPPGRALNERRRGR